MERASERPPTEAASGARLLAAIDLSLEADGTLERIPVDFTHSLSA